ncbi:TetR/AcrR family transcriptional regulator [Roseateles sp.]|uniref:TetR/AcrR family transcriptional regulator n=1 Tax=Roseateles sp. TaxID=1971397 RepID=UPI003BA86B74
MVTLTSGKSGPRPGGRSARVQAAVHAAVNELQRESGRAALTVPMVAARAGVTPSTIYRRWGDLADLLADVAVERMRPDMEPPDTGSLAGDLQAWSEQYLDEMSSDVGRAMVRDVLAGTGQMDGQPVPCRCFEFTAAQIDVILARARQRGEPGLPTVDALMDGIVAPVIYRLLFAPAPPDLAWLRDRLHDGVAGRR